MYKIYLNPLGFVSFFHLLGEIHDLALTSVKTPFMLYSLTMHEYPINVFPKIQGKLKFVIEFCQKNKS